MPIPLGILAVAGAGAGAAGAFDLLETTLISSNTASVTFSNLNNYSDYKHLQLRITNKTNAGTVGTTNSSLRFNGDSGSNYRAHFMRGNGSEVISASNASDRINIFDAITLNNETNIFVPCVIDILDFSSASKNTTIRSLNGTPNSGDTRITLNSGLWNNTAAVTSIEYFVSGASLVAGSRFSLYGIK